MEKSFSQAIYESYETFESDEESINRLLPKCNDRNRKPKRPFSLRKLANYTRKLANFGTFLELKML